MAQVTEHERKLIAFVEQELSSNEHFDYANWDGFIEDGTMDEDDLEFLENNYTVEIKLVRK